MTSFTHALSKHVSDFIVLDCAQTTQLAVEGMLEVETCTARAFERNVWQCPAIANTARINKLTFMEDRAMLEVGGGGHPA